jgi:hypothetical protein
MGRYERKPAGNEETLKRAAKGDTMRKRMKARKLAVLSEIRAISENNLS